MQPFTKALKKGDSGDDVKALQEKLVKIGFDKCFIKEGSVSVLTPDGAFGAITEACLESFQAKVLDAIAGNFFASNYATQYDFKVDGVMDFADWYLLENYEKLSEFYKVTLEKIVIEEKKTNNNIVDEVIKIAKSQIGVEEAAGHNNLVPIFYELAYKRGFKKFECEI